MHAQNHVIIEASHVASFLIAQSNKPHTIRETLIKPCMLDCASIVLGKPAEQKLRDISLSNNTVKRRIDDIAADIEEKVIAKIKESPFFSIQLDESTDVANISQLLVYSRYVHDKSIEEEFMFCQPLLTTTSAVDVIQLVDQYFERTGLMWKM